MAVDFRVEIRDRSFNLLELLENEILDLSWDYSRIGGCGGFRFSLPREYCNEKYISGDFNVRIYIRNVSTKAYDLWYQGLVEDKVPNIRGVEETIDVSGHGYFAQLARIQIDRDYSSQEISVIVKNILDNDITPNTDISYDGGDVVATSFTADTLEFNTDGKSAMQTLAEIVGTREWGVDKDRKFFFKARSSTVGFTFPLGRYIKDFSSDQDFRSIVNNVIVQGAESGGTPFTREVGDTSSQTKYGLREKVVQNSSISTNDVADEFGNAYLSEFKEVVRRARCDLVDYDTRIESTIPIPLFQLKQAGVTYGTQKYGTFLYSGLIGRQINRIQYSIDDNRNLKIRLDLGYLRPSIAENLAQLEHKLEQVRNDSL